MAGLDDYGYKDPSVNLITVRQQRDEKQNEIDESQNKKIKENKDVNDEQEAKIVDLEWKVDHISGGTVTDFDFGNW